MENIENWKHLKYKNIEKSGKRLGKIVKLACLRGRKNINKTNMQIIINYIIYQF